MVTQKLPWATYANVFSVKMFPNIQCKPPLLYSIRVWMVYNKIPAGYLPRWPFR